MFSQPHCHCVLRETSAADLIAVAIQGRQSTGPQLPLISVGFTYPENIVVTFTRQSSTTKCPPTMTRVAFG